MWLDILKFPYPGQIFDYVGHRKIWRCSLYYSCKNIVWLQQSVVIKVTEACAQKYGKQQPRNSIKLN